MKFSLEISEELNNISPLLAGIEKRNVFTVPEGYFDGLFLSVLKTINNTVKVENLSVPAGYFQNLSESVLDKIRSLQDDPGKELRDLSPMLYSIQNENVFRTPAGYFRDLEFNIVQKVKPQTTKVVELKKRDSIWKYAAAAIITGVIGVSSLMIFNGSQQSSAAKGNEQAVAKNIKTAAEFKNSLQVNTAIASLSDDEIIKYLEKTGTDSDNETLAAGIDEKTLPETQDYLLDENALKPFLNSDKASQN